MCEILDTKTPHNIRHRISMAKLLIKTIWRETYEVWDVVCYGVGKIYYKISK